VKAKLVKDLMVPLSEYATVSQEATLGEAVAALKQAQADYDQTKYRHRAILVYDQDQKIVGKVNFQSILKALEPKYDDMLSDAAPSHLGFTRTLQKSIIDQFKLWQDPLDRVCEKAAKFRIKTFMNTPKPEEKIAADTPLDEAIHYLEKISVHGNWHIVVRPCLFLPALAGRHRSRGKKFCALPGRQRGALAVFLLAATWWVFEVVPIGVTSLTIGVLQVLFLIRPAKDAFKDFMDPSVLFIFGSIVVGLVFTKTGLTRRIAYKMLGIVGEKTSMIYLGCFVLTSALTHIMAHTAVAATIYPLLVAIYAMYGEGDKPTKFGKGLFIGMAYMWPAPAPSSPCWGPPAVPWPWVLRTKSPANVGFFELSYYMAPIGWLMTFLLWGFFMVVMKPEKARRSPVCGKRPSD
jgi:hypothetical protein